MPRNDGNLDGIKSEGDVLTGRLSVEAALTIASLRSIPIGPPYGPNINWGDYIRRDSEYLDPVLRYHLRLDKPSEVKPNEAKPNGSK